MEKTQQIRDLEALLDFQFDQVINPQAYLHSHYPASYREVMSPEEEMVRTYHSKHIFVNEDQEIIGINLFGCDMPNEKLQKLLNEELPALQTLNLGKTGLSSFRFSAAQPKLVFVDIGRNEALTQVEFVAKPTQLKLLDALLCAIQELVISGLEHLEKIDVSRNKALSNCTFTGPCPQLTHLDLSENQLTEFHLPKGFDSLELLFLHDNKLTDFSFAGKLSSLLTLHLRSNKLTELPSNILELTQLESLYLFDNPWEEIKDYVSASEYDSSREKVFSYLNSIRGGATDFVNEGKMILVGNGGVGKTSIRYALKGLPIPEEREETEGIEIDSYEVKGLPGTKDQDGPIDFTLNVWDFGGQGKYREIQQLFCTRNALYLFVTAHDDQPDKGGEEYVSFAYWLQMVSAYGHDKDSDQFSPIIFVVNKWDEKEHTVIERFTNEFDHIYKKEIQISAKDPEKYYFSTLVEAIKTNLPRVSSDIFNNRMSQKWIAVIDELENEKSKNYLSLGAYQGICEKHSLSPEDGRTLLFKLNRMGKVIHFGDHPELAKWIILDPEWIREAMYVVINDDEVNKKGILSPQQAVNIWEKRNYPAPAQQTFLQIMEEYRLSYKDEDEFGNLHYVVPACLPKAPPLGLDKDLGDADYRIKVSYKPFVPAGTVNKLIVLLHQTHRYFGKIREQEEISPKTEMSIKVDVRFNWKNNIFLYDRTHQVDAHIQEDWKANAIFIQLFGKQVKPLYRFIFQQLQELNQELRATKYLRGLEISSEGFFEGKWVEEELWDHVGFFNYELEGVKSILRQLLDLISQNRFGEAMEIFKEKLIDIEDQDFLFDLISLEGRWNACKSTENSGTKLSQEQLTEKNQIRQALIDLVKKWSSYE